MTSGMHRSRPVTPVSQEIGGGMGGGFAAANPYTGYGGEGHESDADSVSERDRRGSAGSAVRVRRDRDAPVHHPDRRCGSGDGRLVVPDPSCAAWPNGTAGDAPGSRRPRVIALRPEPLAKAG